MPLSTGQRKNVRFYYGKISQNKNLTIILIVVFSYSKSAVIVSLWHDWSEKMRHNVLPTLLDAPSGRKLRVDHLNGSREIRSRLYSMGILPGTELEVYNASRGNGCVCVRVRQASVVLGETMAEAVCYADEGPCQAAESCRLECASRHLAGLKSQ